ncbi:MAG: DUF1559 domain-containing protein, partial [Planctomycetota bacterium]
GILLPSLGSARESARSVQCLSRVRQLGLATTLYGLDFDDMLPPHNTVDPSLEDPINPGVGANVAWCWAQVSGDIESAFRNGSLSRYLDDVTAIAGCPSWRTPDSAIDWGLTTPFFSEFSLPLVVHYGYNGRMLGDNLGGGVWKSKQVAQLGQPAKTVLFTDSGQLSTNLNGSQPGEAWPQWELQPPADGPNFSVTGGNTVHGRHARGDKASTLWADGHASSAGITTHFATPAEAAIELGTIDPNPKDGATNDWWDQR